MISEQGLCVGCGICQALAGSSRITVTKTTNGYERPVVTGKLTDDIVTKIYDICPGVRIDGLPQHEITEATKIDNVWGPTRRIVRAWATEPNTRFEGATGGVLTALACFLLRSKRVDFILHVKSSDEEPTFGAPQLSFTEADVMAAAGSRYGPAAPLTNIDQILARNRPFALIGKPCYLSALRNLARHDECVDKLVKYWLTFVCGGIMTPAATDAFLHRIKINPRDVKKFRYRGRGCPGPMRIETENGEYEHHYLDFWGEDANSWQLPFRCKICPDGIGESADIAAADTWHGGSPTREQSEHDAGVNAIIARTQTGVELLEAAAEVGVLTLEHDITPDEMSIYQPHQMRKKYNAHARHLGIADEGRITPKTTRLRLAQLAAELSAKTNHHQRNGTRERIRQGNASEPTPRSTHRIEPGSQR